MNKIQEAIDNPIAKMFLGFWSQNRWSALISLFLTSLYYPLEIIGVSNLTSKLFILLDDGIQKNLKAISITIILLMAVYLLLEIVAVIKDYLDTANIPKFEQYVREEIIKPVIEKNLVNYDNVQTVQLIQNLGKIPRVLSDIFERLNRYLIPFFIIALSVSIYFSYLNWQLGLASILFFVIYFGIFRSISHQQIEASQTRERAEGKFNDEVEDIINNLFMVTVANNTERELGNIRGLTDIFNKVYKNEMQVSAKAKFYNGLLALLAIAGLSFVTLRLSSQGAIPEKSAVAAFGTIIFMSRHFRSLARRVSETMIEIGSLALGNEYLQAIKTGTTPNGSKANFIHNGEIVFQNLSFKYPGTKATVFDHLNYVKPAGACLTIVGPSGSGKSTLIKMLNGFYTPTSGGIYIDGVNIRDVDRLYLRQAVSYLPQNTRLFNRSVLENMVYGTGHHPSEAVKVLEKLRVAKVFKNVDLHRNAGRFGDKLSGGQKQLVHLVRIYLSKPKIVILDEPTTGIDVEHRKYVKRAIKELAKEINVILVTHEKDMVLGETLNLAELTN